MQSFKCFSLTLVCVCLLNAQSVDDPTFKQVIVFSRHGVRSPSVSNDILSTFAVLPFPDFGNASGCVTRQGAAHETLMGAYHRLWLTQEGLLTGDDAADFVYIRPNPAQVTTTPTAEAWAGFLPAATTNFSVYPRTNDPVFDSVPAGGRCSIPVRPLRPCRDAWLGKFVRLAIELIDPHSADLVQ
jgi:4-phytase/acid phosphatase